MSEAELHDMMRDPRYWRDRDPEFIGRVTAGFRDLFEIAAGPAPEPSPAAEIAALRARVAELEDAIETERSNTAFEQDGLRAMRLDRDNFRRQLAASEASRARLATYIRADDDLEYAISCGDRGEIAVKHEAAVQARRLIKPEDLAPETPHG